MPVIDEKGINNGNKLSDDQILRIEAAIHKLADNSHNAQAITLYHNLKQSKDIEEKRKWIVLYYISCFQLLSFINLARDKELPLPDFNIELTKLFEGK